MKAPSFREKRRDWDEQSGKWWNISLFRTSSLCCPRHKKDVKTMMRCHNDHWLAAGLSFLWPLFFQKHLTNIWGKKIHQRRRCFFVMMMKIFGKNFCVLARRSLRKMRQNWGYKDSLKIQNLKKLENVRKLSFLNSKKTVKFLDTEKVFFNKFQIIMKCLQCLWTLKSFLDF